MKQINYALLIENLEKMINVMEHDSERGSGKAKLNAQQLEAMYSNVDRYKAILAKQPVKKTPNKEV